MNNSYMGETTLEIFGRKYPMIFNMNVVAEFEANAGKDFNHVAISAINAFTSSALCETIQQRAEILTKAISRADAAWLFYLAAKEADSFVTFEEMQEAVMLEGFLPRDSEDGSEFASYPILFIQAVSFATMGYINESKKKKPSD